VFEKLRKNGSLSALRENGHFINELERPSTDSIFPTNAHTFDVGVWMTHGCGLST